MLTKQQILEALYAWIRQRPGLEFCNYGDLASYRSELRSITKDLHDAQALLTAVAIRDSITAENLIAAFPHAYSGRLSIAEDKGRVRLNYYTGQYWPTEYRKAACAVLASVLWEYARASIPERGTVDDLTPGDWLCRHFRHRFGRGIQKRWFD